MEKILSKSATPDIMWATATKKNNKNMRSSHWITENFKSLVINKPQPPRHESNWASIKALMEIKEIYAKKVLIGAITFICLIGFSACKDEVVPPEPQTEHPIIGKKWELIAVAKKLHNSIDPVPDSLWENAKMEYYFELLPDSSFKHAVICTMQHWTEPDEEFPASGYIGTSSNGKYWYDLADTVADINLYKHLIIYSNIDPSLDNPANWWIQQYELSDDGNELKLYTLRWGVVAGTTKVVYRNCKYRRAN
ncbi:MAG: hypothetical protein FWG85_06835 [Bacteroidetes bacterium]|nr:hypothetical protein [Bacteroidota bacterium]